MIQTVFYYKYSPAFAEQLYRLNNCNKIQRLLIIDPIAYSKNDFCMLKPSKYIFVPNTVYIAIEYLNYHVDPFFFDTMSFVEVCCVRTTYTDYRFRYVSTRDVYIEILLPFMPKMKILKKIGAFYVSTEAAEEGLYKLTFVRKRDDDITNSLLAVQKDVGAHIPDMPILVIAVYSANWFSRYDG